MRSNADTAMVQQARIVRRDPREERSIKMERVKSNELKPSNKSARNFMERSTFMKALLKVVGVLGVSLVISGMWEDARWWSRTDDISDGVLTPAQSVLGAIQG